MRRAGTIAEMRRRRWIVPLALAAAAAAAAARPAGSVRAPRPAPPAPRCGPVEPIALGPAPADGPLREVLPRRWRELRFSSRPRGTRYRMREAERGPVLHAVAEQGASLLYTGVDAAEGISWRLRWAWRVDRLPEGADLAVEATDDAAARVYVGFRHDPGRLTRGQRLRYRLARLRYGEYPPYAGVCYVWATRLPAGTRQIHPAWPRLAEVVLESGGEDAGRYVVEERDPAADYRAAFGGDPPPLSHVAVMTDADDTGSRAAAWYADLELVPETF